MITANEFLSESLVCGIRGVDVDGIRAVQPFLFYPR
jgi:hypothetical protein